MMNATALPCCPISIPVESGTTVRLAVNDSLLSNILSVWMGTVTIAIVSEGVKVTSSFTVGR